MSVGNYLFHGINEVEHQTRYDQFYTGVPGQGGGQALLIGPSGARAQEGLVSVEASNPGTNPCVLRLRHGGAAKPVSGELLAALSISATHYGGSLQFRSVVPSSMVITEGGAQIIIDDGLGVLHDSGDPAAVRGTVDYDSGAIDFTAGAALTEPVVIAYDHEDFEDFTSAVQTEVPALPGGANPPTAGDPHLITTAIGRINPGSVDLTFATGPLSFVDDGKGNLIEDTTTAVVRGTVDYAAGIIAMTDASAALAGAVTLLYTYNPFASVLNPGGGSKLFDLFPTMLPELTAAPWSAGIKDETKVALWGECTSEFGDTNLITKWGHFGETYQVESPFSGFPPGGESNS